MFIWTQPVIFAMRRTMQLFVRGDERKFTEKRVSRASKQPLSDNEIRGEVLRRLLAHDALSACDSRSDLELIAQMQLPDNLWNKIEAWALEMDCECGEALWQRHEQIERERIAEKVKPRLDAIFFSKDGSARADANERLDLAVELAEAENPQAIAAFNSMMRSFLAAIPVDADGKVPPEAFKGFMAGLNTSRISKAHIALARIKACPSTPYWPHPTA